MPHDSASTGHPSRHTAAQRDALRTAATTLVTNGHTTTGTINALTDLGGRWGLDLTVVPTWDHTAIIDREDGTTLTTAPTAPAAVNMHAVAGAMKTLTAATGPDQAPPDAAELSAQLRRDAERPPYPDLIFAAACITGACALAVIFGSRAPLEFALIAAAAGAGGLARRAVGRHGVGLFGQAFLAALIGALTASAAHALATGATSLLVALCPAMVLVPGPHLLNGMLDLAGRHISLGLARIAYALIILAAICTGLVIGLAPIGGLPPSSLPLPAPPAAIDILAAAVAAASYPVYFGLRPRHIVWPVLAGAAAHGAHYLCINQLHTSNALSVFAACLVAGLLLGPVAHRQHLPFSGIGFAAVVALVPGVYVFRTVSGMVQMARIPTTDLLVATAGDFATATVMTAAMGAGLVLAHRITRPRAVS